MNLLVFVPLNGGGLKELGVRCRAEGSSAVAFRPTPSKFDGTLEARHTCFKTSWKVAAAARRFDSLAATSVVRSPRLDSIDQLSCLERLGVVSGPGAQETPY